MEAIFIPKLDKAEKINGQTYINIKETTIITPEVIIGTNLFPLKKAKNLGSSIPLKQLYNSAEITPHKIPIN